MALSTNAPAIAFSLFLTVFLLAAFVSVFHTNRLPNGQKKSVTPLTNLRKPALKEGKPDCFPKKGLGCSSDIDNSVYYDDPPSETAISSMIVSIPSSTNRKPANFIPNKSNLFDQHKVKKAFNTEVAVAGGDKSSKGKAIMSICFGPTEHPNFETFMNEDLLDNDLTLNDGYTVLEMKCGDQEGVGLINFIVILDNHGAIINTHGLKVDAGRFSLLDTHHIMIPIPSGEAGMVIQVWNWKDDSISEIPIENDSLKWNSHFIQFSHTERLYYSLQHLPTEETEEDEKQKQEDKKIDNKKSPDSIVAFDESGKIVWQHTIPFSHINYLSFDESHVYASVQTSEALVRVNKATHQSDLIIGGPESTESIWYHDGKLHDGKTKPTKFSDFQMLSSKYFSLFDNHIISEKLVIDGVKTTVQTFRDDGERSRMVLLEHDQSNKVVKEIFSFDTGDYAHLFGSADVVPSGNILGSSYPQYVEPMNEDRQYQANIFEVTPKGSIAWRVGVKGLNPWDPDDSLSTFSHSSFDQDHGVSEKINGWVISTVERLYEAPVFSKPCLVAKEVGAGEEDEDQLIIRLFPFNTIRTQGAELPGKVYFYDAASREVFGAGDFSFQRAWLARAVDVPLAPAAAGRLMTVGVENSWGDYRAAMVGPPEGLPWCEEGARGGAAAASARAFYAE